MKKILIVLGIMLVVAAVVLKTNPPTEQNKCCADSLGVKDSCIMPCSTYIVPKDTVHDTTVVVDTVEVPREY